MGCCSSRPGDDARASASASASGDEYDSVRGSPRASSSSRIITSAVADPAAVHYGDVGDDEVAAAAAEEVRRAEELERVRREVADAVAAVRDATGETLGVKAAARLDDETRDVMTAEDQRIRARVAKHQEDENTPPPPFPPPVTTDALGRPLSEGRGDVVAVERKRKAAEKAVRRAVAEAGRRRGRGEKKRDGGAGGGGRWGDEDVMSGETRAELDRVGADVRRRVQRARRSET
jgi:hypothetical protein